MWYSVVLPGQMTAGTVSKATLGILLRDGMERIIIGFSERIDTMFELNWTESHRITSGRSCMQRSMVKWVKGNWTRWMHVTWMNVPRRRLIKNYKTIGCFNCRFNIFVLTNQLLFRSVTCRPYDIVDWYCRLVEWWIDLYSRSINIKITLHGCTCCQCLFWSID